MTNAYFYSSTAVQTQLTGGIGAGSVTAQVSSTVGWPSSYPFVVSIDYGAAAEELVVVTNNSLGVLTITRGFDSTSAQSHGIGAVVRHVYCANDATAFRTHEAATAAVHGVAGTIVGTSDTQTLANKTLTAPVINGASLSGTLSGTPTFSGNVVFSANPNFSGAPTFSNIQVTGGSLSGATISGNWTANSPTFIAGSAVNTPLLIQGFAAQSVDLFVVQNNTPTKMFRVVQDGRVIVAPTNSTNAAFVVNGPTGTTGDIQDWQINGSTWASMTSGQNMQFFPASGTAEILGSQAPSVGTFDMVRFRADGRFDWGPGTATRDTNLYRSAIGTLKTDTAFLAQTLNATTVAASGNLNITSNMANAATGFHYRATTGASVVFQVDQSGNMTTLGSISANIMAPAEAEDTTSRTTTSLTFVAVGTLSQAIVLPASGKLFIMMRVTARNSTTLNSLSSFDAVGSTSGSLYTANDLASVVVNGTNNVSLTAAKVITGVAGETVTVTPKHRVNSASTMTMDYRNIICIPMIA